MVRRSDVLRRPGIEARESFVLSVTTPLHPIRASPTLSDIGYIEYGRCDSSGQKGYQAPWDSSLSPPTSNPFALPD